MSVGCLATRSSPRPVQRPCRWFCRALLPGPAGRVRADWLRTYRHRLNLAEKHGSATRRPVRRLRLTPIAPLTLSRRLRRGGQRRGARRQSMRGPRRIRAMKYAGTAVRANCATREVGVIRERGCKCSYRSRLGAPNHPPAHPLPHSAPAFGQLRSAPAAASPASPPRPPPRRPPPAARRPRRPHRPPRTVRCPGRCPGRPGPPGPAASLSSPGRACR
jgi:hypothetical protein